MREIDDCHKLSNTFPSLSLIFPSLSFGLFVLDLIFSLLFFSFFSFLKLEILKIVFADDEKIVTQIENTVWDTSGRGRGRRRGGEGGGTKRRGDGKKISQQRGRPRSIVDSKSHLSSLFLLLLLLLSRLRCVSDQRVDRRRGRGRRGRGGERRKDLRKEGKEGKNLTFPFIQHSAKGGERTGLKAEVETKGIAKGNVH